MSSVVLVKALYPYSGADQAVPLPFAESAVLLVVQRTDDGWCRGFSTGREGWFPASYVRPLENEVLVQKGLQPSQLAALMHSADWTAYGTEDDRVYYVNTQTQVTTWELPVMSPSSPLLPVPEVAKENPFFSIQSIQKSPKLKVEGGVIKSITPRNADLDFLTLDNVVKSRKPKYHIANGLTYMDHSEQQPLNPTEKSYVDHFWADKGDHSGFEVILEKHLNGKFVMKDMMEYFRERASIEEQYARSLLKLSKSSLGDIEEGTLGSAWQSVKAELRCRSEAHSKFASQLLKEMEKPLFEFKESQKKGRKEHQQIMEKSRKLVQSLDTSIEKARALFSGKPKINKKGSKDADFPPATLGVALGRRKSSVTTGDDLKKMEENYNQAQRQWVDNMINACQDYERQEDERSDYLKEHFLKYVDLCVGVDEANAESLSRVTDAIDRIRKKADREHFIKTRGTGTLRPVDRVVEL